MEGLSINYIDSTNEDVVVTYTPSSLVSSYSYVIVKDNVYGEPTYIATNTPVNITLNQTGTYRIEITNVGYNGITSNIVFFNPVSSPCSYNALNTLLFSTC